MKAQELRIGNLVMHENTRSDSFQTTVTPLSFTYAEKLHPIPLTEEWLIKFGFTSMLNQFKKKGNPPFIILKLESQFRYDDLRFQTNIKYVHQLQNLYFALTGTELEIKDS